MQFRGKEYSASNALRWLSAFTFQLLAVYVMITGVQAVWSDVVRSQQDYADYQKRADTDKEKAAAEIAARCNIIFTPGETLSACLAKAIKAQQENDNSDKDLQAQQDMALWAKWMFIISVLSLVVSGFGLYTVWQSLRITRDAITNDREVGHAQVRAYVAIDMPTPNLTPSSVPRTEFKILNSGQSPARNVAYIAGFQLMNNPLPEGLGHIGGMAPDQEQPRMSIDAGGKSICEAFGIQELTATDLGDLLADRKTLFLFARVSYQDVFRVKHETSFCGRMSFELMPGYSGDGPRPWRVTMLVDNLRSYSD